MQKSILTLGVLAVAFWLFAANGPQAPLPAPAQEKAGVTKYEYKIVWLGQPGQADEKTLNEFGADGWDVGPMIASHPPMAKVVMKRPKR